MTTSDKPIYIDNTQQNKFKYQQFMLMCVAYIYYQASPSGTTLGDLMGPGKPLLKDSLTLGGEDGERNDQDVQN